MPSIPRERRAEFVYALRPCPACGAMVARNYCRTCDEFFEMCECPRPAPHASHRLYLWTSSGIVAIPDFDHL